MKSGIPTRRIAGICILAGITACAEPGTAPEPLRSPTLETDLGRASGLSVYNLGHLERAVPDPCPSPGTRGFDFWLGSWNVERNGAPVATDVVTSELDGCVVMEDYIASTGAEARSMSVYEAATGQWHQAYQDNLLGNYRLSGTAGEGLMELSGGQEIYHFGLGKVVHREATSTWSAQGDGTVHQTILGSFDGGPTQVLFDGLYRPVDDPDRADPAFFPFCQNVLPGFRELDFWIGSWTVAGRPGDEAATAEVEADLNGCLLQQDLRGRNGYRSRSFLFWDFAENRWFRTLADNSGAWVQLTGGLVDGAMVLIGTDQGPDGRQLQVRNTIAPRDGDVIETWEVSGDGGATWVQAVGLTYRAP